MKKLEIKIPENYEIDKEKSTFECIVFKEVKKQVSWDDFGEVKGYYISGVGGINSYSHPTSVNANENTWPSKEAAEAALALSQLCQWRNKVNGEWRPDWSEQDKIKYCIGFIGGNTNKFASHTCSYVLAFKSAEIRDKFLEDFRELIEQAKPLL